MDSHTNQSHSLAGKECAPTGRQQKGIAPLSVEDRELFFEIIEPAMRTNTPEQYGQWTQTFLQRLFPHGMMACGIGRICKEGVKVQRTIGCNLPPEYLQALQGQDGLITNPIMSRWLAKQRPILFEPGTASSGSRAQSEWMEKFQRFGMVNLAAHGQCDMGSHTLTFFNFFHIPTPLTLRHAYLLKLLVPHLHVTLARVANNHPVRARKTASQPAPLTAREREILEWLGTGKTNWEIAQIFGISEATVKNHVHHILRRLNASTRAQAVAKAVDFNLIRLRSTANYLNISR